MSVRLDKCVTFEESPDDGIYMRRLTPADVLELARSLEGAKELLVEDEKGWPTMTQGPFFVDLDHEIASELGAGRYLVIGPLKEEE